MSTDNKLRLSVMYDGRYGVCFLTLRELLLVRKALEGVSSRTDGRLKVVQAARRFVTFVDGFEVELRKEKKRKVD